MTAARFPNSDPMRMARPKSFFRVFTEAGPLIAVSVAVALLLGIVGPASAQFFNFGGPPPPPRRRRSRRLVRRGPVRAVSAAAAEAAGDPRGFLQGAAAGEARSPGR